MRLSNYTPARAHMLNMLSIPEIDEPYRIKILWLRPLSFDEKNSYISTELHLHNFFEVHLLISGEMEYASANGETFTIHEGNGILFSPCVRHIVKSHSPNFLKFSIAFTIDDQSDFYNALIQKDIYTLPLSDAILSPLNSILEEASLSTAFSLTLIRNRMLDILCSLTRSLDIFEYRAPSHLLVEDKRVTTAKLYIQDNINRFLSCDEVAKHLNLSAKQMDRIFYAATGKRVHEYIGITRIHEAERLLTETTIPLKAISDILGFSSVYYFNRYFSKSTGVPPAYFRKISAK